MDLKKRLIELRKQKGYKQEDIAQALNISQAQYSRIEKSPQNMTLKQLFQISSFLNVVPELILVDNLIYSQQNEIRFKVFFESTLISWIKDSCDEILSAFDADLNKNLLISSYDDKKKLALILKKVGEGRISALNVLSELDDLIWNYLAEWDLIISKVESKIFGTLMDRHTTQAKHGFLIKKS